MKYSCIKRTHSFSYSDGRGALGYMVVYMRLKSPRHFTCETHPASPKTEEMPSTSRRQMFDLQVGNSARMTRNFALKNPTYGVPNRVNYGSCAQRFGLPSARISAQRLFAKKSICTP